MRRKFSENFMMTIIRHCVLDPYYDAKLLISVPFNLIILQSKLLNLNKNF